MKKIMFALGVALSIGMTQAASLNWAISLVNKPDSTVNAGGAVYMFLSAAGGNTLSYVDGAQLTTIAAVTSAIEAGTFTGAGAYVTSSLSSAGGVPAAATGVSGFDAGDSLTAFVVIFDNADPASASNYLIAQNVSGAKEISQSWTSATGAKMLAWGSQASNSNWTAVPEPTSGLLMILGMAGLALKRKRA